MRKYVLVPFLFMASTSALEAQGSFSAGPSSQNSQCSIYPTQARNVCNAAVDGTRIFHPVAGLLVSGGNPVIGTAASLGGFPHFAITARVNAVQVAVPDLNYDGSSSTVPLDKKVITPAPLVEAGLGLWKGLNGGLLSIDALGSAQLLPTNQIDNLTVDPNARKIGSIALGLGYGARVGILKGSFPIPAVSVSVMKRTIPRIQYGDLSNPNQDYQYAIDLQATNLRLVASTRLLFINFAAGLGWDKYVGDATIAFREPLTGIPQPPINLKLNQTRTMVFANTTLDFPVVKVAAEIGYQGGKDQNLATDFQGFDEKKGHIFGGVGLRIGF
jgi:hypothetical protein